MWIYLSPHLDDAILSCGAIIAAQVESGEAVEVWTLFAGKPSNASFSFFAQHLHSRYGYGMDPIGGRINEDKKATRMLKISSRYFYFLEAIYRKGHIGKNFLYPTPASLFAERSSEDHPLLEEIKQLFQENLQTNMELVVPMGVGGHVDHLLVRQAAEERIKSLWYYEDFPYGANLRFTLQQSIPADMQKINIGVTEKHVYGWPTAIASYESQLPILWPSMLDMEKTVWSFYAAGGGRILWHKNET